MRGFFSACIAVGIILAGMVGVGRWLERGPPPHRPTMDQANAALAGQMILGPWADTADIETSLAVGRRDHLLTVAAETGTGDVCDAVAALGAPRNGFGVLDARLFHAGGDMECRRGNMLEGITAADEIVLLLPPGTIRVYSPIELAAQGRATIQGAPTTFDVRDDVPTIFDVLPGSRP